MDRVTEAAAARGGDTALRAGEAEAGAARAERAAAEEAREGAAGEAMAAAGREEAQQAAGTPVVATGQGPGPVWLYLQREAPSIQLRMAQDYHVDCYRAEHD